ncbi:MAG: hypothetical protein JXB05_33230 [Myxococcaceae bacterium]|nr:hypothetical protein [Myxococcaceae bacterium]
MKNRIFRLAMLPVAALPLLAGCGGIQDDIQGKWASTTCETRPGPNGSSLFVKRVYEIQETTWTGTLSFFTDNTCTTETISAVAEGPYKVESSESAKVAGTHEAEFTLGTMKLTPKNQGIVDYLKSAPAGTCGSQAAWAVNATQDVTSTKGCSVLGIDLQNCGVEFELVKLDDNGQLLFGARPADGSGACTADKRPTTDSFQPPLKKEGEE